jgi:hypothetical protein
MLLTPLSSLANFAKDITSKKTSLNHSVNFYNHNLFMKNTLFASCILALSLCSFVRPTTKKDSETTIRITLESINCHGAQDHRGSEELYGKLWVLNLNTYKSVSSARTAFNLNELMKVGDGSGSIWSTDRNHLVVLKKNQSRTIRQSTDLTCKRGDKLIILGDLDERDYRNSDDVLESRGTISEKIINTANFSGSRTEKLVFISGGTNMSMTIKIQLIN